jgi:hypothetical protein
MIGRFLSLAILLVVVTGLLVHWNVEIPFISPWMGHLPGDLILKKGEATLYLPFATSALFSLILTLLSSLFDRK